MVVDDGSDRITALATLCRSLHADFQFNEKRMNHTHGDLFALCRGLRWADKHSLDVLVKMSRRFVPKQDWRPGLRKLIMETQHATYAGILDATYGLRTECVALHVSRWMPKVEQLEKLAKESKRLWVEDVLHRAAMEVLPLRNNEQHGFARWDFPGLGKWVKTDSHLWHDTADPRDYSALARQHGLAYNETDFQV